MAFGHVGGVDVDVVNRLLDHDLSFDLKSMFSNVFRRRRRSGQNKLDRPSLASLYFYCKPLILRFSNLKI